MKPLGPIPAGYAARGGVLAIGETPVTALVQHAGALPLTMDPATHAALASAQGSEVGAELVDELEPRLEVREITIPTAQHGERLDRVLAQHLREFSRSHVQQLMAEGAIEVCEPSGATRVVLKPATRVRVGQVYRASLKPTPQSQAFVPQAMDLRIVYEDEHLRIIDADQAGWLDALAAWPAATAARKKASAASGLAVSNGGTVNLNYIVTATPRS